MITIPKKWRTPFVAEAVAITQYVIKAVLKIWFGGMIASTMIRGDGFHNLADIVPAVVVTFGIWLRKQRVEGYPYQLREVESWLTLAIGLLLGFTAFTIGGSSALGLLGEFPGADHAVRALIHLPHHEPVRVDPRMFWPLVALMSGSLVASLLTARFQISVGKETGEMALVADGKETRADGMVEAAGLAGVFLVQFLHWHWAEYVLGLVVGYFVYHTAWEILKPSLFAVLKRSLGKEVENEIRRAIETTCGVKDVGTIKTFLIGRTTGVCVVRVTTELEAERFASLRTAIHYAVKEILLGVEDVRDVDIDVVLKTAVEASERVAYLCRLDYDTYVIVDNVDDATRILICDPKNDDVVQGRIKAYELPTTTSFASFLAAKHVRHVLFHGTDEEFERAVTEYGIEVGKTYFTDPEIEFGVTLP